MKVKRFVIGQVVHQTDRLAFRGFDYAFTVEREMAIYLKSSRLISARIS